MVNNSRAKSAKMRSEPEDDTIYTWIDFCAIGMPFDSFKTVKGHFFYGTF